MGGERAAALKANSGSAGAARVYAKSFAAVLAMSSP